MKVNNNTGNPVPLLDKKIITDIRDLLESQIKNSQNSEMDCREYMIEYLNILLQNGVETKKEQPKCKSCNYPLETSKDWCDECGYDQGN